MFIRTREEVKHELEQVEARRKELRNELKRVDEYQNYAYFMDKAAVIVSELRTHKWSQVRPWRDQKFVAMRSLSSYRHVKECDQFWQSSWSSPAGEVRINVKVGREAKSGQWYGNYQIDIGSRSKNTNRKLIELKATTLEEAQEAMLVEMEKAILKIKIRFQKKFDGN